MPGILIASEARPLLPDDPVPGHEVQWFPANEPVPGGPFVAVVPLVNRWVGGMELKRLPDLKIIANIGAGVDNIDLVAAQLRGIIVTNTPDVTTEATADLTLLLILAVARRLKEGQRLLEAGQWKGWDPTLLLGMDMKGRTLGIAGAGKIGQAVARRALGFGLRILYAARAPKADFEHETAARFVDLPTLLRESDIVSLHLPSAPATRGIIDAAQLGLMRPHALLINTARGDLVREPALLAALNARQIAGAGLDVFPDEPKVHPDLIAHQRVVVLPHIGSATEGTRRRMAEIAVANVVEVLGGREPVTRVV